MCGDAVISGVGIGTWLGVTDNNNGGSEGKCTLFNFVAALDASCFDLRFGTIF